MKNYTLTMHTKKITRIQKHNDRNFESDAPHINKELTKNNLNWTWCGGNLTNEEAEKLFYKLHYKEWMKKQNKNYAKTRHKEKIMTYEDKLVSKRYAPTEMLLTIGNKDNRIDPETIKKIFFDYKEIMEESFGSNFHILDFNLHLDEPNANPHFHIRSIIDYKNKDGNLEIAQDKGLEAMGIPLKDPTKKRGQKNNRAQVFRSIQEKLLIDIAKDYNINIVKSDRPGGKDLKDFKEMQDMIKNLVDEIRPKKMQEISDEIDKEMEEERKRLLEEKKKELLEEAQKKLENKLKTFQESPYFKEVVEAQMKDLIDKAVEDYKKTAKFGLEVAEKISEEVAKEADRILDPTQKSTGAKGEEMQLSDLYDQIQGIER